MGGRVFIRSIVIVCRGGNWRHVGEWLKQQPMGVKETIHGLSTEPQSKMLASIQLSATRLCSDVNVGVVLGTETVQGHR